MRAPDVFQGGVDMAAMIQRILQAGAARREVLNFLPIAIGGVLMLGAAFYRFFQHPEWTLPEALEMIWPYYLAGASTLFVGWLIDRNMSP